MHIATVEAANRRTHPVDWIVVERSALGEKERDLLDRLLLPDGGFRAVRDGSGVTVARRVVRVVASIVVAP